MNEHDRAELGQLQRRQDALQMQLTGLEADIRRLSSRLQEAAPPPEIIPYAPQAFDTAPPIAQEPAVEATEPPPQKSTVQPPPLPPVIAVPSPAESLARPHAVAREESRPVIPPIPPRPSRPRETFEMKLGTYWLVRVGIVM